jgi:hypothetical protein
VPCTSGFVGTSVTLPANSSPKVVKYTFDLSANGSKAVKAKAVKVTVAAAPPPTVTGFTASPPALGPAGGSIALSAQVTGATSCVFSSATAISGLPSTIPCTAGTFSSTVTLPANTSPKAVSHTFRLSVIGSKTVKAKAVKVTEAAKPARPAVASLSPTSGPLTGGTLVDITGTNLSGATEVSFGSILSTKVTPVSATSVTAISPATASAGSVNVTVVTPGGTSATNSHDTFNYLPTPIVTSVSPPSGPPAGGTIVTVTGTDLSGATSVHFGLSTGTIIGDSATSITATSPAELTGTVNVTVTTAYGTSAISSLDQFTYASSFTPCSGPITADSEIGAGTYQINCTIDVPSGITLAIDPGATLKFDSGAGITVEGSLNAVGTAANPIVFTSINDNSIGGATGSGSPAPGDWDGVSVNGSSSIDLAHCSMNYMNIGVFGFTTGSVTIVNSALTDAYGGAEVYVNSSSGTATLSGNSITTYGSAISTSSPEPTVSGNTVTSLGGSYPPITVSSPSLDLSRLTGNSISAGITVPDQTTNIGFGLSGTLANSGSLPSESYPWELDLGLFAGNPAPAISAGATLDVPSGMTLTISPGTILKNYGDQGHTAVITVEGSLNAVGTAANPIVFTSINDNSIGGATGSGSPAPGDWDGVSINGTAVSQLQDTSISYASTGVIDTQGTVVFRGQLVSNDTGIGACDWGGACSVDAAFSYWGSAAGPYPPGGPNLACGSVTVSPWFTSVNGGSTADSSDVFQTTNCDGTPAPDVQLSTAVNQFNVEIGGLNVDCSDGLQSACQEAQGQLSCLSSLVSLAGSQSPFTFPAAVGDFVSVGSSYLESSESEVVSTIGSIEDFAGQIIGAASTLLSVAQAYHQCAQA